MKFQFFDDEKIEKIKQHFEDHKDVYIAGAVCFTLGGLCVSVLKGKKIEITNTVTPIFNNNNSSNVHLGGYAHKVVKCLETGQLWETVKEAAEEVGVARTTMSNVLNGRSEGIQGKHYQIIALGTAA